METILLAVTAVSLIVALIMSAAAWRMSREERARSAARVAALAAAASDSGLGVSKDPPLQVTTPVGPSRIAAFVPPRPAPQAVELTLNPSASARDELDASYGETSPKRPDFERREGGLAADELPLRVVGASQDAALQGIRSQQSAIAWRSPSLDRPAEAVSSDSRQRGLMVAAAVLFALLGGGAYWTISGGSPTAVTASASAASSHAPLELMSLRHERQGGRLTLSGLVRNPSAGAPLDGLAAVAFLFDAQGGFISSARVGVDFKRLAPGDESPFVIAVDAPSNVARYRVSFRTDAGVVAHVDRRTQQPVATAITR